MSKIILSFLTIVLFSINLFSQSPESFNYQAVVRNPAGGIIANQTIGLQISILQGDINGTVVYQETFSPTSNTVGLVNLAIGTGNVQIGIFENIDWENGPFFIETAMDISGGANYEIMGTSELLSVPYALYAKTAGSVNSSTGGLSNIQMFMEDGSFIVPDSVTKIMVEIWGAGGGGGGGDGASIGGCGGMGGGYGKSFFTVTPGSIHNITIGQGGLGGADIGNLGADGGTSNFGTPVMISATGGQGGNGQGTNIFKNGGTSTGQLRMEGQRGHDSNTTSRHYGGLAGDGSRFGEGGIGDVFFGRDGANGAIVIYW